MTAIVAPTIIRIACHFAMNNGQIGEVINDISLDEGIGSSRADQVPGCVSKFQDAFQTNIAALVHKPVTYTGLSYTDLHSLDTIGGDMGPNASKPVNNGSTSSNMAPAQVAILVTKHCGHTRRQRPGRMFLPGVNSAAIDNTGALGTSYHASIQAGFDAFRVACENLHDPLVEASSSAYRVVHKVFPSGWDSTDVTSFTVQSVVATQRGRNIY